MREYVVARPNLFVMTIYLGPEGNIAPRSPEGMLRKLAAASFVGDSSSERKKPRVEEAREPLPSAT